MSLTKVVVHYVKYEIFFNGCGCERVMRYDLEDPGEIKSFDRI